MEEYEEYEDGKDAEDPNESEEHSSDSSYSSSSSNSSILKNNNSFIQSQKIGHTTLSLLAIPQEKEYCSDSSISFLFT